MSGKLLRKQLLGLATELKRITYLRTLIVVMVSDTVWFKTPTIGKIRTADSLCSAEKFQAYILYVYMSVSLGKKSTQNTTDFPLMYNFT